jgi:hypothetical protein
MRIEKLTKKLLKKHPDDVYRALKAVDEEFKHAFVSEVFFSKEDCDEMKKTLTKLHKKERSYLSKKAIETAVAWDWLGIGPNESYAKAIRPGYALIDDIGIARAKALAHKTKASKTAQAPKTGVQRKNKQ